MSSADDPARVWMSGAELDGGLRDAICEVLPPGATFGFNYDGAACERAWVRGYGVETAELVAAARRHLGGAGSA